MKIYKYDNFDYTALNDDEVMNAYKVDKEVVFTKTTDAYTSWLKSGQVDSFGHYVLKNKLGLALCYEEGGILYNEAYIEDCINHYGNVYIDEKLSTIEDIDYMFIKTKAVNASYENYYVPTEAIVASSELRFIYEKDYDDEHAIQLWADDKANKYYKILIFTYIEKMPEVLSVMTKVECKNEIEELENM